MFDKLIDYMIVLYIISLKNISFIYREVTTADKDLYRAIPVSVRRGDPCMKQVPVHGTLDFVVSVESRL